MGIESHAVINTFFYGQAGALHFSDLAYPTSHYRSEQMLAVQNQIRLKTWHTRIGPAGHVGHIPKSPDPPWGSQAGVDTLFFPIKNVLMLYVWFSKEKRTPYMCIQ